MNANAKRAKIEKLLNDHAGKVYTVTFLKKDGSTRMMNCRDRVVAHLRGGESTIKDKAHLHGTFDMQEGDYRCFNLDTVSNLKVGGMDINFPEVAVG